MAERSQQLSITAKEKKQDPGGTTAPVDLHEEECRSNSDLNPAALKLNLKYQLPIVLSPLSRHHGMLYHGPQRSSFMFGH